MKSAADFRRILQQGVRLVDRNLWLRAARSEREAPRLGIMVGRRYGNAPLRNRFKRLLREAFRLERAALPGGVDLICGPHPGRAPSLAEVRASLLKLSARAAQKLAQSQEPQ